MGYSNLMDPKKFYSKKLDIICDLAVRLEAVRSALAQLSTHEENASDPDHSEFFHLGEALEEAAAQVDGLKISVVPLVQICR